MSNDPEQALHDQVRDEQFRQQMKDRASTDPKAKKWVELDESAQKQEQRVGKYENEISKRQNFPLNEVEQRLQDARDARDEFLQGDGSHGLRGKAYDDKLASLHQDVDQMQRQFEHQLRYASPEKIEALQARMAEKQEALNGTVLERQAIATLPSEERAQAHAKSLEERSERVLAVETPAQTNQGQSGEHDTPVRGMIDFSNYAKTAEEELAYMKQLEEDQRVLHQQLGRRATDEEMHAYQAKREADSVDTAATSLNGEFQARVASLRQTEGGDDRQEGQGEGRVQIPSMSTFAERKAAREEQRVHQPKQAQDAPSEELALAPRMKPRQTASM